MGSTCCVRCGATLVPHLYCDVCDEVVCFTCSSCSSNLEDTKTKSFQLIMDDSNYSKQNQFNDELKYFIIKLSTSYWFILFECTKVVNRYCRKIFNLGINSMT